MIMIVNEVFDVRKDKLYLSLRLHESL